MNHNYILNLLDNGLDAENILAELKNASPKIATKISQMFLGGYGAGEIVKYLLKDKDAQKIQKPSGKPSTPFEIANMNQIQNAMSVPKGRDAQAREDLKRLTPKLIAAGMSIAPYALPKIMGEGLGAVAGTALGEAGQQVIDPQQGQLPQAPQTPLKAEEPQQQTAFELMIKDVDLSKLDPNQQRQLQFLSMISDQLQFKENRDLTDPSFKNIEKKVKKILKGKPGIAIEESARFEQGYPGQQQAAQSQMIQQQSPMQQNLSAMMQRGIGLLEELKKRRGM